ncbi:aspartate aminotransferase family protein [Pseudomonas sp. PDM12]|uniref:aspartate aminotransferase family protein n=1 Tax=Pseudomonas sp. PDM12 TaxID=2769260 RepID=UPI001780CD76|nr:aspartate aminotransferase family protein [Pseudomonas sp. PDM12]MBD9657736.1 aspartate aminotransferase family protein [Pseudomonas sp. PDM12]
MSLSLINRTRQELLDFVGLDDTIVSASGTQLVTAGGQTLVDFVGQFGAVPFGYAPQRLVEAATAFLASPQPTFVQPLLNPVVEALARRLIEVAPGDMARVTFTTSGAETVEAAIKLVRAATGRELVVGTLSGFHGKTQGAVGVTGKAIYRESFQIRTDGYTHVPYGDLAALEALLRKQRVAAFFVEAVQGEAGMLTPPDGYLLGAQQLCRQYGALFVLDEIQTGLGRTGALFAASAHGLSPDVLLLAKALGGGLVPIGACLYAERCWSRDFDRHHSSTFAMNGFTASVGLAVLDQLAADDGAMVKQAAARGTYLREGLQGLLARYPQVFAGLDGRGLMLGLKFRRWSGERLYSFSLASAFGALVPIVCGYLKSRHGVYCLPTLSEGNVLRIQPSFRLRLPEVAPWRVLPADAQRRQRAAYPAFFRHQRGGNRPIARRARCRRGADRPGPAPSPDPRGPRLFQPAGLARSRQPACREAASWRRTLPGAVRLSAAPDHAAKRQRRPHRRGTWRLGRGERLHAAMAGRLFRVGQTGS